jgi:hypothetical protein
VLHESLDGPALARGVASLEHDHVPPAGALAVVLQLQQLDLQPALQPLVLVARHAVLVGVALAPRVDVVAVPVQQDRVVVVLVVDGVAVFVGGKGVQIYLCHGRGIPGAAAIHQPAAAHRSSRKVRSNPAGCVVSVTSTAPLGATT